MKLKLNKNKLKNLSKDSKVVPGEMTPRIGGGGTYPSIDVACSGDCSNNCAGPSGGDKCQHEY